MVPAAAIAAGVVGGPLWWLVIERGDPTVTYKRGLMVGACTGVLAHPVTWFVMLALEGLVQPAIGGLAGVARVLGLPLFFGFWGLILAGWLTVFLGCLGGLGLTAVRTRY